MSIVLVLCSDSVPTSRGYEILEDRNTQLGAKFPPFFFEVN